MKGITEERLTQLLGEAYAEYEELFIYNLLNTECVELNPWQPIDENTTKDKFLLLYSPGIEGVSKKFVGKLESCWYWKPAHWCELPLDPPSV